MIGSVQDITPIDHVTFDIDYKNLVNTPGTHTVPVTSVVFYSTDGSTMFGEGNKNENIKYDTTGIMVSVTVESKNTETNGK